MEKHVEVVLINEQMNNVLTLNKSQTKAKLASIL